MTFEKYLTDNCGLRILEGLTNLGMETTECTFPGKLWDEQYPERMDEHQIQSTVRREGNKTITNDMEGKSEE